jgi:hypothetical protein
LDGVVIDYADDLPRERVDVTVSRKAVHQIDLILSASWLSGSAE